MTLMQWLRLELGYFHDASDLLKWLTYPRCPRCRWRPTSWTLGRCVPCVRRSLR